MSDIEAYFRLRREMAALATAAFDAGENVVNTLVGRFPDSKQEAIEIAYELQAGSYTANRDKPAALAYRREQHGILLNKVLPLAARQQDATLLDAGTGEGTGWYGFDFAKSSIGELHAVDISLRRLSYVKENVTQPPKRLSTVRADLRNLPYFPGSFDVVVTMHAVEPNGGSEREILDDLAALSSDMLCLFEPDFAAASPEGKDRMRKLGYALEIFETARALPGFEVVFERPLPSATNPLNPTSVICLKHKNAHPAALRRKSPLADIELADHGDHFAETGSGASAVFPVIGGIDCMRKSDAVMKITR